MNIEILKPKFAVCQLAAQESIPEWPYRGEFYSVTRTAEELSIVCEQKYVPAGTRCDQEWRILKVEGPLDFSLTGILSSIAKPLADAKISIFSISTFNTDYILAKDSMLEKAVAQLREAGFTLKPNV